MEPKRSLSLQIIQCVHITKFIEEGLKIKVSLFAVWELSQKMCQQPQLGVIGNPILYT